MTVRKVVILLPLFLAISFTGARSQSLESLRAEAERAREDIARNTAILEGVKKDQKTTQTRLKLTRSNIESRRAIISSLDRQMSIISEDMRHKQGDVDSLNTQYNKVVEEYSHMVRAAYKNYKLNNFLLFLFASEDFDDATRRIAFMQRYNRSRELKAAEIASLSKKIGRQITTLDSQRAEMEKTRSARSTELVSLSRDEALYNETSAKLSSQEKTLAKDIREKRQQLERAQRKIEQMIAEEAKRSRTKQRTAAEEREITALSGRFDQNRGKLPRPVRGGVIVDHFGIHEHPMNKTLKVNNTGVNFAAPAGAEARSVFDGEVASVFFVQGLNNCVMLRHGIYFTVYANLSSVTVKKGDKVTLNQSLGKLSPRDGEDDYMLHFEIWKEGTRVDPELWLSR